MNKKKLPGKELVFQAVMVLLFTLMLISCIYPFYYIFIASISSPDAVKRSMITWYPLEPTLANYVQVFKLNGIMNAFLVSIARTFAGTAVTLFFTSILAYTLTKKRASLQKNILLHSDSLHVYQCRIDSLVSDNEDNRLKGQLSCIHTAYCGIRLQHDTDKDLYGVHHRGN